MSSDLLRSVEEQQLKEDIGLKSDYPRLRIGDDVHARVTPERFDKLANAIKEALEDEELQALLERAAIGGRWVGPDESEQTMRETFEVFRDYAYLLKN